jgi:prepilin-type processing-associated H-X9-DG protein
LTHTLPATNSALAARKRDRELGKLLHCPSDTLPRAGAGGPRSYAMSAHDMRQKNWPPGPNNSTGVGLSWTFGPKGDKPPPERVYNFKETNKQAVIKISMLPSPKDTLLLTELIATNNGAWRSPRSAIRYTGEHLNTNQMNPLVFHDGTINYLMVDGHVETLQPSQTVGPTGQAGTNAAKHFGIWTIKAGD